MGETEEYIANEKYPQKISAITPKNTNINYEYDWILENGGRIRCDCCYNVATTRYYDKQLMVFFDVCEDCRTFLTIQEELDEITNTLPKEIQDNLKNKIFPPD